MMPGAFAESFGGRWVAIAGSGLEIFLPSAFEEATIGDAERQSGYTAQYRYAHGQLGVGKWAVDAGHGYEDELAYNRALYGEENVHAVMVGNLPTIFCRDVANNTLMLLYPDNAGGVFFAVGHPLDDDGLSALYTTVFHSLRTAQQGGERPADEMSTQGHWLGDDVEVLGSGDSIFWVLVLLPDRAFTYEIHTDETYLLDALLEVDLIAGEQVSWGYNVTTVAGVRADHADGAYWVIYQVDAEGGQDLEDSIADTRIESGSSGFAFAYIQE